MFTQSSLLRFECVNPVPNFRSHRIPSHSRARRQLGTMHPPATPTHLSPVITQYGVRFLFVCTQPSAHNALHDRINIGGKTSTTGGAATAGAPPLPLPSTGQTATSASAAATATAAAAAAPTPTALQRGGAVGMHGGTLNGTSASSGSTNFSTLPRF